jgi:hypothetical protein
MKPTPIEIVHANYETLPTVAATAPIENNTNAGTPLATQNAPFQVMCRCKLRPDVVGLDAIEAIAINPPTVLSVCGGTLSATAASCPV